MVRAALPMRWASAFARHRDRRAALPGVGRLGMDQFPDPRHALPSGMASVLYRCATTGMNVQAWFADDVSDDNLYVSLRCPACARVHLVNRAGRSGSPAPRLWPF